MISFRQSLRDFGPAMLAALAALAFFFVLWQAHPPQRPGAFDWARHDVAWPDVAPFTIPGIPRPIFYDLQVLLWGVEQHRAGLDPHTTRAADAPYFFNYPRIWLHLAPPGTALDWTRPLGLGLAAGFLLLSPFLLRAWQLRPAVWFAAFIFSPPVLEGIGHGNNDLFVFLLLAAAAVLWSRRRSPLRWPALGLVGLAALLKIYPACALLAFVDGRRRAFLAATTVGLLLILAFALDARELAVVSARTPRPHAHAVGSQVLGSRVADAATRHPRLWALMEKSGGHALWTRSLAYGSAAAFLALLALAGWYGYQAGSRNLSAGEPDLLAQTSFRLGAAVYLACFAIGHNFLHREILFVLFSGRLLAQPETRWIAWLALGAAWLGAVPTGPGFVLAQALTWILAGALAHRLACDLSPDLKSTAAALTGPSR